MTAVLPLVMVRCVSVIGLALISATLGCRAAGTAPERIAANDNRVAAGELRNGVLTVSLEAREGQWYPDGDSGPGLMVQTFAEAGHAAQNPGPMIRVPAGTTIQLTLRSALRDSVLIVYGLHTRPGPITDTIQVAPGVTRALSFVAGAPGTYFYWGTTTHRSVDVRNGIDSQLHGAFIIDPPGAAAAPDRVFVLGSWTRLPDSAGLPADLRVINGLSWPHTEQFTFTAGDTIRWRWVNPTDSPHPMHLHGFYFDVMSRGSWAADTIFTAADRPQVVTEMPLTGGTFTMRWVPQEPGNWLMHCHIAFHTSLFLSAVYVPDPKDPLLIDPMAAMRGMVLAVTVRPGVAAARRPETTEGARYIRLVAQAASRRFAGVFDEMAFVHQDGAVPPAPDSVPTPSSLLVLRKNQPVRINIVNHTRATTGVHWHGIEVPSYSDGVGGWSGSGSRLAKMIAPGDSFTAAFTPTRSGTFIYHAHSNEVFQVNLGLYGGLIVADSGEYHPERERLIILGGHGPAETAARINGKLQPDTMRLTAGITYRLRLIHIIPDWTARLALMRGDSVLEWKALAKDGAELPPHAQTVRRAALIAGPGETMDFEFQPTVPGLLRLVVVQRTGLWKTQLPIRVYR